MLTTPAKKQEQDVGPTPINGSDKKQDEFLGLEVNQPKGRAVTTMLGQ
jgi:hypothetical protein